MSDLDKKQKNGLQPLVDYLSDIQTRVLPDEEWHKEVLAQFKAISIKTNFSPSQLLFADEKLNINYLDSLFCLIPTRTCEDTTLFLNALKAREETDKKLQLFREFLEYNKADIPKFTIDSMPEDFMNGITSSKKIEKSRFGNLHQYHSTGVSHLKLNDPFKPAKIYEPKKDNKASYKKKPLENSMVKNNKAKVSPLLKKMMSVNTDRKE